MSDEIKPTNVPTTNEWKQGACQCTNDAGLCFYTMCCPCLAFKEAAENIGEEGALYCLATWPFCFGCCTLAVLGDQVAKKRGIESDLGGSAVKSFFNVCICYACTVVNEARLYESEGAGSPSGQKMERG